MGSPLKPIVIAWKAASQLVVVGGVSRRRSGLQDMSNRDLEIPPTRKGMLSCPWARVIRSWAVAGIFLCCAASAFYGADSQKDSLLAAWENAQRSDRNTVVFERLEEGLYRFQTERFPFDGEIRVNSVYIDDTAASYEEGAVFGVVEVELLGADDDFFSRYGQSYGFWMSGNTLYLDEKTGEWLTSREWSERRMKGFSSGTGVLSWFSKYSFLFFLLILVFFLYFATRGPRKQMKSAMAAQEKALSEQERAIKLTERAVGLTEDSNRVLHEILKVLKEGQVNPGDRNGPPRDS
jgi:hypothetical protein